jgi:hypothetical protein
MDLDSINEHMKSYSFNSAMDPIYVDSGAKTCNKDFGCPNYVCVGNMVCPDF